MLKPFIITFVANPDIMVKFQTDRMELAEKIINIVSKPYRQTSQREKNSPKCSWGNKPRYILLANVTVALQHVDLAASVIAICESTVIVKMASC